MTKKEISEKKAVNYLHRVFTAVPSTYDVVNRLITLGMDSRWRNLAVRECLVSNPQSVLDICCGTGDMALAVARLSSGNTSVTGFDFSKPMLELAERKAEKAGLKIRFVSGDVAKMPFSDHSFERICVGFGFRNLTYKNPNAEKHLSEILRVLKKGGRFVIAESSQPKYGIIKFIHKLYVRYFVYTAGKLVSGDRQAYKYLASSVEHYYSAEELRDLLLKTGFCTVTFRRLFFGAAAVHVAVK